MEYLNSIDRLIYAHLKTENNLEKIKKMCDDVQRDFNEYKRCVQMNKESK